MVTTVSAKQAVTGPHGEIGLAQGERIGMRMWRNEEPKRRQAHDPLGARDGGLRGERPRRIDRRRRDGDAGPRRFLLVPAGAEHTYRILETFTAVEATSPPAK